MKSINSFIALEKLGRVQLSKSFFMRDMLYSEIANFYGISNIPEHPDLAIEAGKNLCENLLEPLQKKFGRISIRSAYRSPIVNQFGNEKKLGCASNMKNFSKHIWDHKDQDGHMGAMATIIINALIPYFKATRNWQALAWYIHDNLPYSTLCFYPKLGAFNIGWHERPIRRIDSHVSPTGCLTMAGMDNHTGGHSGQYKELLTYLQQRNSTTKTFC